ncbi:DUF2087 domain-containing protein [Rhodopseudomonas palustris]|uniref:DUF2087 domain-containing protein n=1 Tax=Rhodopseudomonas palustris TaxID=1076 RepID=UPI002ACD4C74|nr:DUF2087 domain-containing protein [Rhodopseudomonas palustris]WQH00615.1 DUF2087 domain-containing protein [Rhodopseudomonas palustris]
MTRTVFPFAAPDVSTLARALHRELDAQDRKLGHVQLLNLLTRAAGYRNFQHFRAQFDAADQLQRQPEPEPVADLQKVVRVARYFDRAGGLTRWPKKASHRLLCLWVLWSRVPAGQEMSEKPFNELLAAHHGFGDHALLRRELCDRGLMTRTRDGRVYRRIEQKPPPEAVALIRALAPRRAVISATPDVSR